MTGDRKEGKKGERKRGIEEVRERGSEGKRRGEGKEGWI